MERVIRRRLGAGALLALGLALLAPGPAGAQSADARPTDGLAARLYGADSADEHWDAMARFDSGHRLFFRLVVTNQGPGEHTAVATGHVLFPDGGVFPYQVGRRSDRWEASADGLRLEAGSMLLDLHGPERVLVLDSTKKGIDLRLRFGAPAALGDGAEADPGVAVAPLAVVTGSLRIEGHPPVEALRGTLTLRHAWARAGDADTTHRWLVFAAGDPELGAVGWTLHRHRGPTRRWLALQRGGRVVLETREFELNEIGARGPEGRYPVPERLALAGPVAGEVHLGRELVRDDPLEAIPLPFRWWFARRISPRRIWSEADFRLRWETPGSAPAALTASGVAVVTWLQPAAPSP